MSLPEVKASPVPVSSTTRTAGSASACSKPTLIASYIARVRAVDRQFPAQRRERGRGSGLTPDAERDGQVLDQQIKREAAVELSRQHELLELLLRRVVHPRRRVQHVHHHLGIQP